MIENLKKKTI